MSEENRGSSGGGTAMIVVAILGGILVVGCCGGVVAVGLGGTLLWHRSAPMDMQAQPPMSAPMPIQVDPQVTRALDELNKDLEPLKIVPDDLTKPLEPGSEKPEVAPPLGTDPPVLEEKKE